VKGKPWEADDEKKLRKLLEEGTVDFGILASQFKGKYSPEGIRQKLIKLGLLKEQQQHRPKKSRCCSSKLELPTELPTVEETLKILAAALRKGAEAGLDKAEVQQLQVVANLAKTYKDMFADYLDYRGLEERLVDLEAKYDELTKKTATNAPT
jgi:tryptophan 2,3-dioxygenase